MRLGVSLLLLDQPLVGFDQLMPNGGKRVTGLDEAAVVDLLGHPVETGAHAEEEKHGTDEAENHAPPESRSGDGLSEPAKPKSVHHGTC